jgi:hypothetical protein
VVLRYTERNISVQQPMLADWWNTILEKQPQAFTETQNNFLNG